MLFLYNLFVHIFTRSISLAALLGNPKAKKWVAGRKNWEEKLIAKLATAPHRRIWFHCASLGEFEQGRSLIEMLKKNDPEACIVLSFFSPSGYEVRKDYTYADCVCYLPSDSASNAKKFLDIVSPGCIVFIKYEFWYHYFNESNKRKIPVYIASAIFRPSQIFFKWYGAFFRALLQKVNFFFLQDNASASLLSHYGFTNYAVTGDTRFDRVNQIAREAKRIEALEKFDENDAVLVAGSTWPEDEKMLFETIAQLKNNTIKLVLAPHEVNESRIQGILKTASLYYEKSTIKKFSEMKENSASRLIIIDSIGLLSSVYAYATFAWIGGGFGKGIHNILEAAAYGKPTLFGPKYQRFKEAVDLVRAGGAFSVSSIEESKNIISMLLSDKSRMKGSSEASLNYVKENLGATDKIISMLEKNSVILKKKVLN